MEPGEILCRVEALDGFQQMPGFQVKQIGFTQACVQHRYFGRHLRLFGTDRNALVPPLELAHCRFHLPQVADQFDANFSDVLQNPKAFGVRVVR
ncbi:hypothetical protein D3C76_684410 [compost metagenome]